MLDKNIKYALYGVNRVSKDFIYIFGESINVTIFFDDASQAMSFMGRKVYPVAESEDLMRLKGVYDKIIICDFETRFRMENHSPHLGKWLSYKNKMLSLILEVSDGQETSY